MSERPGGHLKKCYMNYEKAIARTWFGDGHDVEKGL